MGGLGMDSSDSGRGLLVGCYKHGNKHLVP